MKKNQSPQKPIFGRGLDRYDSVALLTCVTAFIGWIILLSIKYFSFGYYDWDFALYAQVMWNLTHGSLYCSLFGMNFLANHAQYIAFFLVPIYIIFNHPFTLIVLKISSYVMGGGILYILAKKTLSRAMALTIMVLFFIFPANIYAMLFEFDFESLSIGLFFLFFYFFQAKKNFPFCVTMFFLTLIKENIPPVIVAFGIYSLFSRQKNKLIWGGIPIVWGTLVFYLSMFIITPALRASSGIDSANQYIGAYSQLGSSVGGIIETFLFHPSKIVQIILEPNNLNYLNQILSPLLFIPLLSPQILLLASPIFLQHLLSDAPNQHTIHYHYVATLVPFIFLAAIHSLQWIQKKVKPIIYQTIFILMMIACITSLQFYKDNLARRISLFKDRMDPIRRQMISNIPPQAGVISTFKFLVELSQRKSVYGFINIQRNLNGLNWQPFEIPSNVSYSLIDMEDPWIYTPDKQSILRIQTFLNQDWCLKDAVEDILLLERCEKRNNQILGWKKDPFLNPADTDSISIDGLFSLLKCKIGNENFGRRNILPLEFYWQSDYPINQGYGMLITIKQGEKIISSTKRRIGYKIFPTNFWQTGDYVKERYWLLLPEGIAAGEYSLVINFFDIHSPHFANIHSSTTSPQEGNNTLKVGELFLNTKL